ncbi:ribosome maturation factor RimP [Rickettsiella massiliensis]|uniref:ribosome maturation factor RimP n=1 Tax=Rickettsiella massiliensis TaxID=676517 RepID=UPI0002D937EF|nr:ribosome maturation factor RimP [Rickettsiella massiliensis]
MMKNSITIEQIIRPAIESLGYELWGCVCLTQGRHNLLRVYIESEKGVNLGDCERVARQIKALIEVEEALPADFLLEVSSPGIDRRLFTLAQCHRFIGANVAIQTHYAIENQRKWKGILKSVEGEHLTLSQETGDLVLKWDNILRANILPEINK